MSLISSIKGVFKKTPKKSEKKIDNTDTQFNIFEFGRVEIPLIIEKKDKDWVLFGNDNLYPNKLKELLYTSAIHNGIIVGKSAMMAGKGFLLNDSIDIDSSKAVYDSLDINTKNAYDLFLSNPNNDQTIEQLNPKFAFDYEVQGAFAMEVVWSLDWTRIAQIKYVDVAQIRLGKYKDGKISEYWYSRDWSKIKQEAYKPVKINAFDCDDRTSYNQLIYVKHGNLEYYGEPEYKGAMSWINIDSQMGLYCLSNIENGFAPSLTIKFYQMPGSPEEKNFIMSNIKNQFGGAKNAGKAMVFFSDGRDNAPDVTPISVDNLAKVFSWYSETAAQQILSGHRVTSPLLFGISVPGSLGGNSELATAYQIFDNAVMAYDRLALESVYNKLLKINNIPVTIKINSFNPMGSLMPAVVAPLTPTG